jgi:hypothetical protein
VTKEKVTCKFPDHGAPPKLRTLDELRPLQSELGSIASDALADNDSSKREIEEEVLAWFAAAYKRGPKFKPEHVESLVLFLSAGGIPSYLVTNDKLGWSSQREAGAFADALSNLRVQLPDRIATHLQAADRKDSSAKGKRRDGGTWRRVGLL